MNISLSDGRLSAVSDGCQLGVKVYRTGLLYTAWKTVENRGVGGKTGTTYRTTRHQSTDASDGKVHSPVTYSSSAS